MELLTAKDIGVTVIDIHGNNISDEILACSPTIRHRLSDVIYSYPKPYIFVLSGDGSDDAATNIEKLV